MNDWVILPSNENMYKENWANVPFKLRKSYSGTFETFCKHFANILGMLNWEDEILWGTGVVKIRSL